ncbi:hypothetical protein [Clostridium intestinale]|uniref:Uncharacterized protein n=1 Tax=Clostridium intestinale TaxID=36845 RepID=A0A7D6VST6_9CLOT|nr:hypothetical protein [Clostridium intestinale]QLY81209.1 hypothetical protein HZF06_06380 [Clostridium intestinale]
MDKKTGLCILGTVIGLMVFMISMHFLEFSDIFAAVGVIGAMSMGYCLAGAFSSKIKAKVKK